MPTWKTFITKISQWEYWPTYMFYVPLIPHYILEAIKAKHPVFYLATNPAIKYSGNGTESKFNTLELIPEKYKPRSILITENTHFIEVLKRIEDNQITYPLIVKPDIGFRGYLVKKIDNEHDLKEYFEKNNIDAIIQEFIEYENECGIFYHRIPGEKNGKITSITLKKFPFVMGDGTSTLSEIIKKDSRAYLYYNFLKSIHGKNMNSVPKKDELIKLSIIGNHSKGTQFINGNYLIDNDLERMIDNLSQQVNNWYYGRLDIKYESIEKLKKGQAFKIVEINGIISEPTHIYDPSKTNYFSAVKSIKNHWKIMKKIAITNHKKYNIPYPEVIPYLKDIVWLRGYSKKLKKLNRQA